MHCVTLLLLESLVDHKFEYSQSCTSVLVLVLLVGVSVSVSGVIVSVVSVLLCCTNVLSDYYWLLVIVKNIMQTAVGDGFLERSTDAFWQIHFCCAYDI